MNRVTYRTFFFFFWQAVTFSTVKCGTVFFFLVEFFFFSFVEIHIFIRPQIQFYTNSQYDSNDFFSVSAG